MINISSEGPEPLSSEALNGIKSNMVKPLCGYLKKIDTGTWYHYSSNSKEKRVSFVLLYSAPQIEKLGFLNHDLRDHNSLIFGDKRKKKLDKRASNFFI